MTREDEESGLRAVGFAMLAASLFVAGALVGMVTQRARNQDQIARVHTDHCHRQVSQVLDVLCITCSTDADDKHCAEETP